VAVQPVPPGLVTRESVSTNAQTRCYVDGSLATLGNLRVGMMAQIFPGKGLAKEIWATTSP